MTREAGDGPQEALVLGDLSWAGLCPAPSRLPLRAGGAPCGGRSLLPGGAVGGAWELGRAREGWLPAGKPLICVCQTPAERLDNSVDFAISAARRSALRGSGSRTGEGAAPPKAQVFRNVLWTQRIRQWNAM